MPLIKKIKRKFKRRTRLSVIIKIAGLTTGQRVKNIN